MTRELTSTELAMMDLGWSEVGPWAGRLEGHAGEDSQADIRLSVSGTVAHPVIVVEDPDGYKRWYNRLPTLAMAEHEYLLAAAKVTLRTMEVGQTLYAKNAYNVDSTCQRWVITSIKHTAPGMAIIGLKRGLHEHKFMDDLDVQRDFLNIDHTTI